MTAVVRDLYIEQGATFTFGFTWCREADPPTDPPSAGEPYDITGAEVRMQIRQSHRSPILIDATSAGLTPMIKLGGTADPAVFDLTNGRIDVVLPDVATDLLVIPNAKYDLEIEMPNGSVRRLLQGSVTVNSNITQVEP